MISLLIYNLIYKFTVAFIYSSLLFVPRMELNENYEHIAVTSLHDDSDDDLDDLGDLHTNDLENQTRKSSRSPLTDDASLLQQQHSHRVSIDSAKWANYGIVHDV